MPSSAPLASEYMKYYNKYSKIYGKDKTIVFMQVGSFYEAFSTNTEGADLIKISKITGVTRSRRKAPTNEISLEHPYFLGFPMVSLAKFSEMLIENDFIVVVVDQIQSSKDKKKDDKEREERGVVNIYSRGTFIENLQQRDSNFIACIYISRDPQKTSQPLLSAGLAATDVSTGHVFIHEIYSTRYDDSYALDEIDRFINSLDPKEILIYFADNVKVKDSSIKGKNEMKEYILNYLKLDDDSCRFYTDVDQKYSKLSVQNEILKKVYPSSKTLVTPIEQLDLDKNIFSIISLVLLFDFVYDKNSKLLNNLAKPVHYINNKHLILGNNAIRQLDIVEKFSSNTKSKFRSLFHVINKTSTALGERFLKNRIFSPLINSTDLNQIYDITELLMKNKTYESLEEHLDNIRDIERLQRKMELKILKPCEFPQLITSYESITELIKFLQDNKGCKRAHTLLPHKKHIENTKKFLKTIEDTFEIEELEQYTTLEMETSIFKEGVHEEIDEITESVETANSFIEELRKELEKIIKKTDSKQTKNKLILTKKNNTDGFYFSLTKLRSKALLESFAKKKKLTVGGNEIDTSMLVFKDTKNTTKIQFSSLIKKSDRMESIQEKLVKLNRKYYIEDLEKIYVEFSEMFKACNLFISNIDFIKSSAKTATMYGYSRPIIVDKDYGFVKIKKLRHPIIERLIDYEYVPHDLEMGKNLKGMLLYGLNSSGKSSMMKATGLSIILAQSGLFVPAEEFTFSPYDSLYTRITGDDNIFRGLSSFSLEMVEVNAILKRAGKKTLVIGDEVCRGTEHISGNALVASAILKLSESGATFIFATHLHEIMKLEEIKNLKNVKAYHLNVSYDEKKKSLIFDRELREGSGEQIYGITVAQYIIQDKDFIDTALKIKNKLLETSESMVSDKKSRYNSSVMVHECHLCGKKDRNAHLSNLETHHINFQKDCENGLVKGKKHLQKNQEANLIVLCNECHDKIHSGKIVLDKYVMTSEGKSIVIKNK